MYFAQDGAVAGSSPGLGLSAGRVDQTKCTEFARQAETPELIGMAPVRIRGSLYSTMHFIRPLIVAERLLNDGVDQHAALSMADFIIPSRCLAVEGVVQSQPKVDGLEDGGRARFNARVQFIQELLPGAPSFSLGFPYGKRVCHTGGGRAA